MKQCSNCYFRIVPLTKMGVLRCAFDLHVVAHDHTCPGYKDEYVAPAPPIKQPKKKSKKESWRR